MDVEKLIERLKSDAADWAGDRYIKQDLLDAVEALATLQIELKAMRGAANSYKAENERLQAELEKVKAEKDTAVEAVKNMAEYIVCAGRVDYFLCDEISQEHHLKYQPKNDGNYDNGPCYECVKDWFLQGHKWQEE